MSSREDSHVSNAKATSTNAAAPEPMSLERKLELLEPRFTSPSGHATTTTTGFDTTLAVAAQSPSASHHSFSFEPPTGSRSSMMSSNASTASNLPSSSVRSKRKSKYTTSLHAVAMAAERQMRKVQASPTWILQQEQERSMSALASPPMSNASGSNSTLITSHVNNTSQPQVVAESPPTMTGSPGVPSMPTGKPKAARSVLGTTTDKRKSIPVKRPPTVTDLQQQQQQQQQQQAVAAGGKTTPSRKRSRLQFATDHSPTRTHAASLDANSRDRSSSKATKGQPPRNNTLIRDFFSTAVKKTKNQDDRKRPAASSTTTTVSTSIQESSSKELELLRLKCQELEQQCKDKDAQLKAVSNNQTILHTSLRTALSQKEKELEDFKAAEEAKSARASEVIEKLIRSDNAREMNHLRQKLASDGARLGRIVYTRAGMRAVESWEEGSASKELQKRRADLKSKRAALEERQEEARKASEQVQTEKENDPVNLLGVLEAEESVRLHLDSIQEKEAELAEEEHALALEKADHIRSLKLMASEDASRFRSRPKLHGRYILLALLGKGGFSEVWRAFDLTELREVAVKIHQLDPRWSDAKKDNYIRHVSREYEIHRDVRHARIVSLYDVFEIDNNSFATVLECCKGTDLDTLLKAKKRLPERDARAILIQILTGMQYLSHPSGDRQGIIHYDLKPGNILFDEYGDAKITDFGLSKIVDAPDPAESMELTSQGAGTYWYLPPECFVTHQSVRISNKVDVWSIGVIYYQMLYGKRPFGDGQSQDKVLTDHTMLNAREVHFPERPDISKAGKEFIQACLTYDQGFRPTIAQLCENPYIIKKQQF